MAEQKIIGKGTWIDKLAFELIEREKQLGRDIDGIIRVESGLGASGIPHIGSLGDAVRAYGVKLALENLGYKSELIAYSDDLDGLRKIPEGLDVKEENMGRRVSAIDDPLCDEHDSYGEHMSSLLLDGLNRLGIEYEHKTASQTYKEGLLTEQIHKILVNSKKIGDKIEELTGQEKFQNILPYFPVCKNCDRLYTTESFEYIEDEKKVRYRCKDSEIGSNIIKGCGHEGESDIIKDLGKLAWKVEFAARWQAFDIRFEAHGKDIMDSVKVNDWVSDQILEFPHPHHVKYEMFLDKGGKKISKSLGNVVTSEKWLNYGTSESILLLLYKRITGARELGFEDIPALMDEYNELENIYFGKTKVDNEAKLVKSKGLYEYVNLLRPPENPTPRIRPRTACRDSTTTWSCSPAPTRTACGSSAWPRPARRRGAPCWGRAPSSPHRARSQRCAPPTVTSWSWPRWTWTCAPTTRKRCSTSTGTAGPRSTVGSPPSGGRRFPPMSWSP